VSPAAILFALVFYLAAAVFLGGLVLRVWTYARTPAPLKIPTTPAPTTRAGVVFRMGREVLLFESLFKSNLWIWGLGILFHFGMLLVVVRHLRYFTEPVWDWVALLQPFGIYAGFAMVAGLAGLWLRRLAVERIRYISTPSDHLMLVLLLAIAITGLAMKFLVPTDVIAVKQYMLGLLHASIQPFPDSLLFALHLGLVSLLLAIFPVSKLLHAPGVFFSPTRNQVDNPRDHRHQAQWAAQWESEQKHG
jgi:nitrate reductase gamma subunit